MRTEARPKVTPKYLRVIVDANEPGEGPVKINVRVPLMLLRAGVKLTSHGPVIFTQRRLGRGGRVFHCYKFRTMVEDAEARLAAANANVNTVCGSHRMSAGCRPIKRPSPTSASAWDGVSTG